MPTQKAVPSTCFLALSTSDQEVRSVVTQSVRDAGIKPLDLSESPTSASLDRAISEIIARADCIVADITIPEPSVFLQLGLARALGKTTFLISQESTSSTLLGAVEVIRYSVGFAGLKSLRKTLGSELRAFRRFPHSSGSNFGSQMRSLFAVDWDRIGRDDLDNLCLEVLSQLGYRRLTWQGKNSEVDLIGELPRKDPDGYEYREHWFISLGKNYPPDELVAMISRDPEYFLHRVGRYGDRTSSSTRRNTNEPVIFLVISLEESPRQIELFNEELRSSKYGRSTSAVRLRLWDRSFLTNLVYQFPPIGFKYFSDEGRSRSKFRKTPEQLYEENLTLSRSLILEKDRRVRAERDAVWKDISFSAAHKMGNPIFAIETNLEPLVKRIVDGRREEAVEVVHDIQESIEKAKAIVA